MRSIDEATRGRQKQWLIRRIAWRTQAIAEGGLSERARYFLYNLGLVLDAFGPDCPPSEFSAGVPENAGKSPAYLLDLCRLWREPNDERRRE